MKLSILAGSTSQSVNVFIQDSASTTGAGKTGLVYTGITAYYTFAGANATATPITMATLATVTTAWAAGGFIEISSANMPGLYRFDLPNAVLASAKGRSVVVYLTATGAAPCVLEIELTGWDNQDGVRAGLTALPNVAAGANGGLPTGDASGHVTFANTSIATVTNLTNLPSIPANWLTAAGIAASALNGKGDWLLASSYTAPLTSAQTATAVWADTTAGDFTVAGSVGKSLMNGVALGSGLHISTVDTLTTYTGNTPQTGDAFARLGAPAGASVSADVAAVKSDTGTTLTDAAAIKTQTDKFAFTVANQVDANMLSISGSAAGATALNNSTNAICYGTCSGGTTSTAVVSALSNPTSLTASGQLIGRTIIFLGSTGSGGLQAQASNITASTTGATPTITFTAMTTAPAAGDKFVIL